MLFARYHVSDLARRKLRQEALRRFRLATREFTDWDVAHLQEARNKRARKAEKLKKIAAAGGLAYS